MADRLPLIQILRTPPSSTATAAPTLTNSWPAVLDRLRAATARTSTIERCEFCGVDIDATHGHLVDLPRRSLLCVCRQCYLLFTHDGAGGARFRAVPQRYLLLSDFSQASEAWNALQIPIGLAFFFTNGATGLTTAFYPSPAGATESELPLDAWRDIERTMPPLSTMAHDVEALLVRRTEGRIDAAIVPIDACYELVGRIRRSWHGFQGGDEVWHEIDEFFVRVLERARETHA